MKITGIEGMTDADIHFEIQRGGKFVIYTYCISVLIMTFKPSSDIYFLRSGENAVVTGLGFTALTFLLGWWGILWRPILTIGAFITNFGGGKDVTGEILAQTQR